MSDNPLLDKIRIPGETFRLPSRGLFYKDGELSEDVVDGELHVLPMTTIDELAFKSADKLFTGKAVAEVFGRRIPQIKNPERLLSKDVDYLMMCLRAVSYGDFMEIEVQHTCEDAKNHTYKIPMREIIQSAQEIDPTKLNVFKLELPNGQMVSLRPPLFSSVIKLYQHESNWEEMGDEEIAGTIFENLVNMIDAVDGETDPSKILEWLQEVRAGWISLISDKIVEISQWGVEQTRPIVCEDCGEEWFVEIPTNPITFFT